MPAVSSIQRGSLAIVAADGATKTQAISAVDLSRSIVTFTERNSDGSSRDERHVFSAHLSSTTQISFTRNTGTSAAAVTVEWSVVEFASGALQSLQTGSVDPTASTTDIAITPVDAAASAPLLTFSTSIADGNRQHPRPTIETTSVAGDTLRITLASAPSAGQYVSRWQLIEFKSADAAVQSGTTNINAYGADVTISTVDTGKTLTAFYKTGGSAIAMRSSIRGYVSSSTALRFDAQALGTVTAFDVTWYAIELLDASVVRSGVRTIAAAATTPGEGNPTWSAMINGHVFNAGSYSSAYGTSGSDGSPKDVSIAIALNAGQTSATIQRTNTGTAIALAYQVIDWTMATAVNAGIGALALTGLPATVDNPSTVLAGIGALALTGLPATVGNPTNLDAGVGILTLSGLFAEVSNSAPINAGVGVLTLAGLPADVTATTAIIAGVGVLTLTGLPVELSSTTSVIAGVGALALAGLPAEVSNGEADPTTVLAGIGALALAGLPAEVSNATHVDAGIGALALTGLVAEVSNPIAVKAADCNTYYGGPRVRRYAGEIRHRIIKGGCSC